MSYWRLHYHLVWTTWRREPLLTGEHKSKAYGAILGKAKDLGVIVHAIGGVEDHVHVVASIPPRLAVAEVVRQMKGGSSHYATDQHGLERNFGWQEGYGALTFGERSMADIVAYVRGQEEHHASNKTHSALERVTVDSEDPEPESSKLPAEQPEAPSRLAR